VNIIIAGFHDEKQNSIIDGIINIYNANKCCLVLSDNTYHRKSISNIDILYVKEIIRGEYGVVCSNILPIELMEYIYNDIGTLLDMCSRFEVYLKKELNYEDRKRIIYNHFAFWYSYIMDNEIMGFIGSNIPHDIYDYVIYTTMKYLKRNSIVYFNQSNYYDIIIPMTDYHKQNELISSKYNEYIALNKIDLCLIAKKEWDLQKSNIVPFYMNINKNETLKRIINGFTSGKVFNPRKFVSYLRYTYNFFYLKKEYRILSRKPDYSKKFIYVPLHYQPELTTNPLGGIFRNQMLVIDTLLRNIPDNIYIYIKEHPKQDTVCRYKGFYRDLCQKSNKIMLIDKGISSKELIRYSLCVATVSGTAGWEALFFKKPVLLFGYNFYMYAPYVYNIRTDDACKKSIQEIIIDNFTFDETKFKIFLNAVADTCIHGFIDPDYRNNSDCSYEESSNNILKYLQDHV
jgi:hypothetical protein